MAAAGTLNITGGGAAISTGGTMLSGATGAVTVDGAGSTWNSGSGYIIVGDMPGGRATLNITGGGAVNSGYGGPIGYGSWIRAGATGVVTVAGAGSGSPSTWNNNNGDIYVGDGVGSGTLNITGGGLVKNANGQIGYNNGTGVVTVDGASSTASSAWNNSGDLYVGNSGNGTLNVTGGGAVSNANGYIGYSSGSTGVVTVDGASSTAWANSGGLWVGGSGRGTLNITGGGVVSSTYSASIGYNAGSTGVVTVDGTGSTWNNSANVNVGYDGRGTLNITGGGAVNNATGCIGGAASSTGTGTVDGTGSTWNNSGDVYVGYNGRGTLNITGGGAVNNTNGYIGMNSGSTGVVTVDGASSTASSTWANSGGLWVGGSGRGTLKITGGGTVSNTDGAFVGSNPGGTGVVTVDGTGSTWNNSGYLQLGGTEADREY